VSAASLVVAIFFRLLPIFVVLPVGPFKRVPLMARLSLCVMLSLLFSNGQLHLGVELSLLVLAGEFVLGASIAFAFHSAFAAVHSLGAVLDTQMGTAVGAVFDPAQNQMSALVGETLSLFVMMVFVWAGVHYELIFALGKLFVVVPPGGAYEWRDSWLLVIGNQYAAAFILIGPILMSMWLIDFTLALISRSMPQVQVYFLGLPAKVGIGLLLLAWFSRNGFEEVHQYLVQTIEQLGLMFK